MIVKSDNDFANDALRLTLIGIAAVFILCGIAAYFAVRP
jgi:hypothetical protein